MSWCLRVLAALGLICPAYVIAAPPSGSVTALESHMQRRNEAQRSASETSSAGGFDSLNVTMLGRVPLSAFENGGGGANDIWGYASPGGREYAIVGLIGSTGFVDITDPTQPVIIADIPDANSLWSDIAVFDQFAYNVNESGGGIQIFNLMQIDQGIVTLVGTVAGGPNTSHDIYANPDSGFLYPCLTSFTQGFLVFDLSDPSDPQPVSAWGESCVHDLLVVSYDDCPYAGRAGACEIVFAFACGSGLKIVDVTDKTNMVTISTFNYPNRAFTHQGWLSENRKFLFIDDELDERSFGIETTTYVVNVEDLASPFLATTFGNGLHSIDHNLMVRGDFVFEANYVNGLRVFRASDDDILNNTIEEVGFFDTSRSFPDSTIFAGAWGVYTALPSGVVLVSDEQEGLFILDVSAAAGCLTNQQCDDGNPCTVGICTNGSCSSSNSEAGFACDDGDNCTINGACDGVGTCASTAVSSIPCVDDTACGIYFCGVGGFCECEPCVEVVEPVVDNPAMLRNRFLTVVPGNPGQQTGLEVIFADLAPPFDIFNGMSLWVTEPQVVSENGGGVDPMPGFANFMAATLGCTPHLMDWASLGSVSVYHPMIVPDSEYRVRAIGAGCVIAGVDEFSSALAVSTARFGDVVSDLASSPPGPPDGEVVIADVLAVIGGFASVPGAARKARTDLEPGTLDLLINISDVLLNLSAFSGLPFPFTPPAGLLPCP